MVYLAILGDKLQVDKHRQKFGFAPTNQACHQFDGYTSTGKSAANCSVLVSAQLLEALCTGTCISLWFLSVTFLVYTDGSIISLIAMKNDFTAKVRSVSDLKVHLVLTTKYRKKAFTSEMLRRLHEILEDLLGKWDAPAG